jgi:hypothetical protein
MVIIYSNKPSGKYKRPNQDQLNLSQALQELLEFSQLVLVTKIQYTIMRQSSFSKVIST